MRWRVESVLAVLSLLLALLTAFWPDWIEAFGIEPDGGDGSVEWAIAGVLASTSLVLFMLARRDRRQRSVAADSSLVRNF